MKNKRKNKNSIYHYNKWRRWLLHHKRKYKDPYWLKIYEWSGYEWKYPNYLGSKVRRDPLGFIKSLLMPGLDAICGDDEEKYDPLWIAKDKTRPGVESLPGEI